MRNKTEVRIPYVSEYNSDQIEKIAEFLSGVKNLTRVKLLPYHNYAESKYEALDMEYSAPQKVPEKSEIETAVQRLKSYGLDCNESVKKICKFDSFYDRIEIYHRRNFLWQGVEEKE